MVDYMEAARLAYDCHCASFNNIEQPERMIMPRSKQSRSELAKEGPPITQWDDLPKDEKKRWVDIAKAVGRYIEDTTITTG